MKRRKGLWLFALSKVINNRFFKGCQNNILPLFPSSSDQHKLPLEGGSQQPHRQERRKLLAVASTFRTTDSPPGISPLRCICDYTKPSLGHFLRVLIMLMQNKSKITGASSQCRMLINNLTILQWLVTSGAFWDAKVLEGLLQNLKTLLLPLLCF